MHILQKSKILCFFEFGVGEEEGFEALGIETDLDLVVLGYLITIDTYDRTEAEDTVGDTIVLLPGGRYW